MLDTLYKGQKYPVQFYVVGQQVISPVTNPTDWVSSLVTIVKPDKIRLCIDPQNLNEAVKSEHYPMQTIEGVLTRLPKAKIFSTLHAAIVLSGRYH